MSTQDEPQLQRAVSRWQIVGLSINDVIGSGIYLIRHEKVHVESEHP